MNVEKLMGCFPSERKEISNANSTYEYAPAYFKGGSVFFCSRSIHHTAHPSLFNNQARGCGCIPFSLHDTTAGNA
jgi:hypothetical protein